MIIGNHIYPDYLFGTEIAIYQFAKQLSPFPIQLALAINDYQQNFHSPELIPFKIYPVKELKYRFIGPLIRYIALFCRLVQFQPDVILAFGLLDFAWISVIYKKIFKKKIIVRTEGSDIVTPGNIFTTIIRRVVCHFADQMLFDAYSHLLLIKKYQPTKNPIFLANGATRPDQVKVKRRTKPRELLFVGKLRHVKNVDILLQGFKIFLDKWGFNQDMELNICGDGPNLETLRHEASTLRITRNVNFTGSLTLKKLKKYYEDADIFILPSLSEGFPLVIAEALSYGCPIICSRISSLVNILQESENALFFSPTNAQDLAEKIEELITQNAMRIKMSENNRKLSELYTWEKLGEQLWKIIQKEL